MRIIGEGYAGKKKLGELKCYKCSECGAEYTDIAEANACQAKHFDDRQKNRKLESRTVAALDAPSIRTKPKITVNKAPSALPPEEDGDIPVLTAQNDGANIEADEDDENDLQGLADRLLEQYK